MDRKFSGKYCFELCFIRKNKIQQHTKKDKVFSRNPVKDSTTRRKFAGSERDLEDILRLKSRASSNFGARQTVKLKYRSVLSKYRRR